MKQQILSYGKRAIAVLSMTAVMMSCDKEDDVMEDPRGTITDIVVNNQNFSRLEEAVVKANLQNTLSGAGPFTVFAPNNDGFDAAGISSAVIGSLSADDLERILLYHTLGAQISSADVPAGPNAKVVTAGGDSVFVTRNASGVYINGVMVAQADVTADNGTIHVIESVLMPPSGNLVETAMAPNSGLDSLVKAIVRANNAPGGNPDLIATLQNTTLTVFAPTNAAFTNLLTALQLNDIDQIPVETLLAVLYYHVVPGRAFSSDLSNGNLAMLAGGNATVNLSNGTGGAPTITGNGNGGTNANIIATNKMAENGVVHVIDAVLLP